MQRPNRRAAKILPGFHINIIDSMVDSISIIGSHSPITTTHEMAPNEKASKSTPCWVKALTVAIVSRHSTVLIYCQTTEKESLWSRRPPLCTAEWRVSPHAA